jgi:hypothetical protein
MASAAAGVLTVLVLLAGICGVGAAFLSVDWWTFLASVLR